jgi:hypothetical protein
VQFADIGEQQVKNIPNPVHAYKIEMRPDDAIAGASPKRAQMPPWLVPAAIAAVCVLALGIAAFAYLTLGRSGTPQVAGAPQPAAAAMTPVATQAQAPAPAARESEPLVPETIPFIRDSGRAAVRNAYVPAAEHKALAISTAPIGFSTGQADDATAEAAALDMCQKRADALAQPRKCELYAVGNTVVYAHARPPMPPTPWVTRDPSIERPLAVGEIPLVREAGKATIERNYLPAHAPKALALSPLGGFHYLFGQESADEAARRVLELCGNNAGVPCLVVAIDDDFVVPIPTTMKAVGFFNAAGTDLIAPELRSDTARRLGNGGGWTAVAAGANGKVGLMLKAGSEQAAIDGAMADCAKQDRSCRVIAIGPFIVEPK